MTTIEEKARRYDEALERAKNTIEVNQAIPDIVECVESLFPELLESEDEKIRKYIIDYFKGNKEELSEGFKWNGITVEQVITWLEKQGEPKPACKMQVSDELYEHIRNTCACIDDALSSKSFADINDYLSMAEHSAQSAFDMIEKQSEQKPDYCHHEVDLSNCSEEYRKAYYDGWNNCNIQHSQCKSESNDVVKCLINGMKFYYEDNEEATWGTEKFSMKVKDILYWLEKQGEQKPAEKVEPKFKKD